MALPDVNPGANRFYWNCRFSTTAPNPRRFPIPFPCRIVNMIGVGGGASGGGTDLIAMATKNGSTNMAFVAFSTSMAAVGEVTTIFTQVDATVTLNRGDTLTMSHTGAWTNSYWNWITIELEAI